MQLGIKEADFWRPPLAMVADAIAAGLRTNYREAKVSLTPCPDLRELGCAFSGLGGSPFLIEIGGEPYVHDLKYRADASFDLEAIAAACGRPEAHMLGAGFPSLVATNGRCGELMPCLALGGASVSKIARVGSEEECLVEDYPSVLHGGLGNLYACDGAPTEVVKVEVHGRTGDEPSFPQAIRKAISVLTETAGGRQIGLGGIFTVLSGQVRAHVSFDYDRIPFKYYDQETNEVIRQDFLKFYDGMGPQLMCMSVLWTGDPTGGDLHLRASREHTHFFSTAGRQEGGHYHYDVTPDAIAYTGYFHTAERVVRVNDIYAELAGAK